MKKGLLHLCMVDLIYVKTKTMNKRIRKKLRKESYIMMDLCSIPHNMDVDEWYAFVVRFGLILWSSKEGKKPEIYPKKNTRVFRIIDKN